ncbi:MAPEG family protein [Algimonas porphyrae]|uniref:Membrane protein n=1 Tax=Algimonas porphyrae TaxID=1128113 RepID=A0ABQ5UYT6_9PROT|nr:MAPEG family protein [Algimonas porphyrae]GLQ19550.1 membrane protein [Algimonas porphyrae]
MTNEVFMAPMIALIIWTLIVWVVLFVRRVPAMKAARMDPELAKSPTGEWKNALPLKAQAPAHNYNHLMEQPTIFYAFMVWAVLTGNMSTPIAYLAWAYVGLRIVHSLVQISTGPVMTRFTLFILSTLCLIGMIVLALLT